MTLQITGNDNNGSPLLSLSAGSSSVFAWDPFGSSAPRSGASVSLPGFNGERQDPLSGVTHLGNGYRAFSPALRRFTCPDSESPFGGGGINPYVYCDHDPINNTDPDGHMPKGNSAEREAALFKKRLELKMKKNQGDALSIPVASGSEDPGTSSSLQKSSGIPITVAKERSKPTSYPQGVMKGALQLWGTNAGYGHIYTSVLKAGGQPFDEANLKSGKRLVREARDEYDRSCPDSDRQLGDAVNLRAAADVLASSPQEAVKLMKEAIAQNELVADWGTYYSGTGDSPFLKKLPLGTIVQNKHVLAVSSSEKVAWGFAYGKYKMAPHGAIYRIVARPHAYRYTPFLSEKESHINIGTYLRYDGYDGKYYNFTQMKKGQVAKGTPHARIYS